MVDIKKVKISNLLLDVKNPRFLFESDNQDSAIREMVKGQKQKIVSLAKDIALYGISPMDNLVAMPHPSSSAKYIVIEGNRRFTAIMLLENPSQFEKLLTASQYQTILDSSKTYLEDPISAVNCVIVEDREQARHWIQLRHEGEQNGAGTVGWGADEKARFRQAYGNKEIHIEILDLLIEQGKLTPEERRKVPVSSLRRIVEDKYALEELGYQIINGNLQPLKDINQLVLYFYRIVSDLISKEVVTKDIYLKEDRKKYIDRLISGNNSNKPEQTSENTTDGDKGENSQPSQHKTGETDESQNTENQGSGSSTDDQKGANSSEQTKEDEKQDQTSTASGNGKDGKNKTTQNSGRNQNTEKNRKFLVPSRFKLKITDGRINRIYDELRYLNLETFPNAVAVLFRIFVELSVDDYISRHASDFTKKWDDKAYSLFNKFEDVGKDLLSKGLSG